MLKGDIPQLPERVPKIGERYQHYKGDKYEVTGLALHSNDDIWMVVYRPLYENAGASLFTRPLAEWYDDVEWEGEVRERFSLVD